MADLSDVAEQYKTAANLDARIALHSRFGTAKTGWYRWLYEHLTLPDGARVLEVGCGPAKLWRENLERVPEGWRVTLSDLSAGMVAEAEGHLAGTDRNFAFRVADVQDLPFEDSSFDAVVAVHMLYHVPDQERALSEVRRVLKPGGRFYASTNSRDHMKEIGDLAAHVADGESLERIRAAHRLNRFRLEDGLEVLNPFFAGVTLHRFENALEVTEAEPLLAYILSATAATELRERPSDEQKRRLARFKAYVEGRVAAEGAVRITVLPGLFVATT